MNNRNQDIDITAYLLKIVGYCIETVEQMLSNIRLSDVT
jgi:hypothetical protein